MLPSHIKIPSHVLLQAFDEETEAVLLNVETEHYYSLNEVALRCWRLLENDGSVANITQQLLAEYEVEESLLREDIKKIISHWLETGLVVN